jgi:hypothetical protein
LVGQKGGSLNALFAGVIGTLSSRSSMLGVLRRGHHMWKSKMICYRPNKELIKS